MDTKQTPDTRLFRKRLDKRKQKLVNALMKKKHYQLGPKSKSDNMQPDIPESDKEYVALNEELAESLKNIQQLNEVLVSAKVKAEESDILKTAFLTNIYHEIRTPMNAIIGFTDLLMSTEFSKDKTDHFVQIINASCRKLLAVIFDIIDISKIEAGQMSMDNEWVNLDSLLKDIYASYNKQAHNKSIKLIYHEKPEFFDIETETDLSRLKQILCNLLDNAIKFTRSGKIEFGFEIKKGFIEFFVKDTGIGIAPENHTLIFQRFRQLEKVNDRIYGGSGLGLSISKALVEKLGGTIRINSKLGVGSTFSFTIPYIKNSLTRLTPHTVNSLIEIQK